LISFILFLMLHSLEKKQDCLFDIRDYFSVTTSYQSILNPSVGFFYLSLGLGRERILYLYPIIIKYLFTLRISFISELVVISPVRASILCKPKNRITIYIMARANPYFNRTYSKARICSQVVSLSTKKA
jgi:hypothetical protein